MPVFEIQILPVVAVATALLMACVFALQRRVLLALVSVACLVLLANPWFAIRPLVG
jgi:hypothetical protein